MVKTTVHRIPWCLIGPSSEEISSSCERERKYRLLLLLPSQILPNISEFKELFRIAKTTASI